MQPYSLDLRQKIVDAYGKGDVSQRKLAKSFGVALSFVSKLLVQYRLSGNLGPKIRTEQTPIKLSPEQLEILRQLVEVQPDATLAELQERLREKTDVSIGTSTIDRMLRLHLNLSFKKKSSPDAKGNRPSPTGSI
jgi:transposase